MTATHQAPRRSPRTPRRPAPSGPLPLTAALGVHGWTHLDPVLLGALALEAPVLLIGEHGTAKTLLVERIAAALNSEFRHYNASLVNYDDLVGIPLPDGSGNGLRFVGTAGAVWGAEFVFFDEINRCRPDLQNKMFPIVHERRLAGVALEGLAHRWAAMNPPGALGELSYAGAEALDLALADRFWFAVRVPGWAQLTRSEREALVGGHGAVGTVDLAALVGHARDEMLRTTADAGDLLVDWAVLIVDGLAGSGIRLSARRASMLRRAVLAVLAASRVLGRTMGVREACELVVLNGLPQWAEPEPPSVATVVAANVQAFEVADRNSDPVTRALLAEPDLVQRVRTAVDLGADDDLLATAVTAALAAQPSEPHRIALAALLAEHLAHRALTPAAWSTIAERAARVALPRTTSVPIPPGRQMEAWRKASAWLAADGGNGPSDEFESVLVHACGPELMDSVDLGRFVADVRRLRAMFPGRSQ